MRMCSPQVSHIDTFTLYVDFYGTYGDGDGDFNRDGDGDGDGAEDGVGDGYGDGDGDGDVVQTFADVYEGRIAQAFVGGLKQLQGQLETV